MYVTNSPNTSIVISYAEAIIPPADLTTIPILRLAYVYGRDQDVIKLREAFVQFRIINLNAIGGVGKSTLAKLFLQNERNKYQYCAWIDVRDNLVESFTNAQLISNLGLTDEITNLPKNANYSSSTFGIIANALRNLKSEKQNLLVIDNAKEDLQYNDVFNEISLNSNWHILITSRGNLMGTYEFKVDFLSDDDAIRLFCEFYTREFDHAIVMEIITIVGKHTLAIELLAKSAQERNDTNLIAIRDALYMNGLNALSGNEIQTSYDKVNIYTYLSRCLRVAFELSNLDDDLNRYLECFSILTPNYYQQEDLEDLLPKSDNASDKLKRLTRKGWLFQEKDSYSMHPVVQEAIRDQLDPSVNSCISVFNYFGQPFREKMDSDKSKRFDFIKFIPDISSVLRNAKVDNELLRAPLIYNLASLKWMRGDLTAANELNKEAITIYENNYPESENLARVYNNYGVTSWELSHYDEAESNIKKAIQIFRELGEDKFKEDLATNYNNLSLVYWDMMRIDEAEDYQLRAIKLRQELYKEADHPYLSQSYNNLSIIYIRKKQFAKALRWQLKAYHIRKRSLKGTDLDLAQSYHNLSVIYCHSNKLPKANFYSDKALEIRLETLHPLSSDIAVSYDNLALIRKHEKNYQDALKYQNDALAIRNSPGYSQQLPLAKSYLNLAEILFLMGNKIQALNTIQRAIDLEKNFLFRVPDFENECYNLKIKIKESGLS